MTTGSAPPGPLVVVMTTCDGDQFVRAQLESILAQSHLPERLIVADDASTDDTVAIIEEVTRESEVDVSVLRHETRRGLRTNLERALRKAGHGIIVLSDQDDVWEPGKLAAVSSAFRHPDVAVWASDAELIDEDGTHLGQRVWEATHLDVVDRQHIEAGRGLERLIHGMTVVGATMAFRDDVLDLALPLPPELEDPNHLYLHDGWLAVLGHFCGRFVLDPESLTRYRQHPGQVTGQSMRFPVATPREQPTAEAVRAKDLARTRLVAERLRACAHVEVDGIKAAELWDREAFLSDRTGGVHGHGPPRRVLTHAVRGDYHRFAAGSRSVVKDGGALTHAYVARTWRPLGQEFRQSKLWAKEHAIGHHSLLQERRVSRSAVLPPLPPRTRGRRRGEVWAVGVFRDEQDIAELCVRHLLNQDVDHVLVLDHGSTDGTTQVLEALANREPRVHLATDSRPGHFQKERIALLARAAWWAGASWVVPVDADEFWFARSESVGSFLRRQTSNVVVARTTNMLPLRRASGPEHLLRARFALDTKSTAASKVAFRSHPLALVAPGNHGVARVGEQTDGLFIAHVPYRSEEQVATKFRNGASALRAAGAPTYEGWHWTQGANLSPSDVGALWAEMRAGRSVDLIGWQGVDPDVTGRVLMWGTWDPDGIGAADSGRDR